MLSMHRTNNQKDGEVMTIHRLLHNSKISCIVFAMSLISCTTYQSHAQTTQVSSTPVREITSAFRVVPQKFQFKQDKLTWLKELNDFYPEGFLKVGFSTEDNLEKIIVDEVFIGFNYRLNVCESDDEEGIPIYGSEIFRLNSQPLDTSEPYYIFIPRNLSVAVSSTVGATEKLESGNLKLPSDLKELCVSVGASKYLGRAIELNLGSIINLQKKSDF